MSIETANLKMTSIVTPILTLILTTNSLTPLIARSGTSMKSVSDWISFAMAATTRRLHGSDQTMLAKMVVILALKTLHAQM